MGEPQDRARIQAALAGVWDRTRPVILERAAAVEHAAVELSKAAPDVQALESGRAEAHKLAGLLGTFGLDRGTELARELEGILGSGRAAGSSGNPTDLAAELREVVESTSFGEPSG